LQRKLKKKGKKKGEQMIEKKSTFGDYSKKVVE
jgi:hypothetical protein